MIEDGVVEIQFELFGREITIWAWPCFATVFDFGFDRRHELPPMPNIGYAGERINMAHANLYTPIFGFGIEVWKH